MSRHTLRDVEKLALINRKLSLVDVCLTGFWFCKGCQRITEIEENYAGTNVCVLCESPRIKWHQPLFTKEEHDRMTAAERKAA